MLVTEESQARAALQACGVTEESLAKFLGPPSMSFNAQAIQLAPTGKEVIDQAFKLYEFSQESSITTGTMLRAVRSSTDPRLAECNLPWGRIEAAVLANEAFEAHVSTKGDDWKSFGLQAIKNIFLNAGGEGAMWQRFGEKARKAVFHAQEVGKRYNRQELGGIELLLGLLATEGSQAKEALQACDVTEDYLQPFVGRESINFNSGKMKLAPDCKEAINDAYNLGKQRRQRTVTTGMLLLALRKSVDPRIAQCNLPWDRIASALEASELPE